MNLLWEPPYLCPGCEDSSWRALALFQNQAEPSPNRIQMFAYFIISDIETSSSSRISEPPSHSISYGSASLNKLSQLFCKRSYQLQRCKGLASQMWVFLVALPLTNEQLWASDHTFLGIKFPTSELSSYIIEIEQTFSELTVYVNHFFLFNPLETLWSGYYYSHFTHEETGLREVK